MIYLKDSATGVTVEDGDEDLRVQTPQHDNSKNHYFSHAEADALLRGLLRWKLETAGTAAARLLTQEVWDSWNEERSR